MEVLGVIGSAVGAWIVVSIAAALGLGRAIAIADRRTHRLRLLAGKREEHVSVHRTVTLNTAQLPKISVTSR